MNVTFVNPELLHLLWPALIIFGVLAWLDLRRAAELSRVLSPRMQLRLCLRVSPQRRVLRLGFMLITLLLGVAALMRPQSPGDPETLASNVVAGDVMVVLDTSRSMLAEDAAPNRLGRAKAELLDLLGKLSGQRVGLVAFAGRAQVLCPLTPDYGFFRTVLEGVNTNSVSRGGTRIGEGLREALKAFGPGGGARLMLLITDGEDQDSYPLDAARAAKDAGVRVVAIGFGDEHGSEITLVDPATGARRALTDRDGQVVRSRLDGKTLRDIALATGGAYIPAGVAALDLDAITREHIQPLLRDRMNPADPVLRQVPREHYPLLVLLVLVSLLASSWAGAGARRWAAAAVLLMTLALGGTAHAQADGGAGVPDGGVGVGENALKEHDQNPFAHQPPRRSYNQARAAYEAKDLAKAEQGFLAARDGAGGDSELRFRAAFNLGLTRARRADGLEKEHAEDAIQALGDAAAWFRDCVHQRPKDDDARVNLELVLRRAQQLADRLNQGQNGLEARLQRVLQDQRTLVERVRGLLGRVDKAGGGTEPLSFRGEFDDSATFERTLLADAGVVLDLAGQEKDRIAQKAEDKRSEEERVRTIQLQNLEHYLNEARGTMAEVGRLLRRLQGERAHRQSDLAVTQLKRALEQLADPVTVLKGLAGDEAQVFAETQALHQLKDAAPGSAAPAWLTAPFLAAQQQDLQPRAQELLARLRAGVEHGTKQGTQSGEDPKRERVLQSAREAVPPLEQAEAAMAQAAVALGTAQLETAAREQIKALEGLTRALERFSGLRDLIELIYGEQTQVLALLTPPDKREAAKAPQLTAAERVQKLKESVGRNRERAERLKGLFAEEVQGLEADPKHKEADAKQKEQIAAQKERYRLAEELRQKVAAALQRLEGQVAAPKGDAPRATAKEALDQVEALRRLFFSIIEHLKDLHRQQTGTHDDTSTAQAQKDDEARRRRLGPLAEAQTRHAALGKALAEALAAQADQATQAASAPQQPAGQPGAPQGPTPQQAQEAAKVLTQAAEEVRKANANMSTAQEQLTEDAKAPVSPDFEPTLAQQKEALAHLEQAIQLLEPPDQKDQKDQKQQKGQNQNDQKDQKQLSQEQAARRLQAIREREAERQRADQRRAKVEREPVEKDW